MEDWKSHTTSPPVQGHGVLQFVFNIITANASDFRQENRMNGQEKNGIKQSTSFKSFGWDLPPSSTQQGDMKVNRDPLLNMWYCNHAIHFFLSGRCAIVFGSLLDFYCLSPMPGEWLLAIWWMWCTGHRRRPLKRWGRSLKRWEVDLTLWNVFWQHWNMFLRFRQQASWYLRVFHGVPVHDTNHGWLVYIHTWWSVLIAVRMGIKWHTIVVWYCLNGKQQFGKRNHINAWFDIRMFEVGSNQMYLVTYWIIELRTAYSVLSFTGWLMIGWASVIHNLLFQVQSVQNQCPVASTTWGQGIMVDVMVMSFWSM